MAMSRSSPVREAASERGRLALAEAGADLALIGRNVAKLEETAQAVQPTGRRRAGRRGRRHRRTGGRRAPATG